MTNLEKIKSLTKDEMIEFLGRFDKEKIPYCSKEVCPVYKKCTQEDLNKCLELNNGDYFDVGWWLDQEVDSNVGGFDL